jgi:hypothetical protein
MSWWIKILSPTTGFMMKIISENKIYTPAIKNKSPTSIGLAIIFFGENHM